MRVVDFDQVSLSSLNRHATATRADVGTAKATCLKKHFEKIYPEADVDARVAMYEEDAEDELLGAWGGDGRAPDFVVDCIDHIDTKVDLLAACARRGLRVVTLVGPARSAIQRDCGSPTSPTAPPTLSRARFGID